jgi:hypothetical protein
MKKMILVAVVFLMGQLSMAAGLSEAKIAERIKPYAEHIEKAKERTKGDLNAFKNDKIVKRAIVTALEKITADAKAGSAENIMMLIHAGDAKAVLSDVAKYSSIIKNEDGKSSELEIKQAKKALELLSLSGNHIDLLQKSGDSKNEAEAKVRADNVALALKVSNKIASFGDYKSERAKKYVEVFEAALTENKSVHQAMDEANTKSKEAVADKKDIKEEDILSCEV